MSDAELRLLERLRKRLEALEALERPRSGGGIWTPTFQGSGTAGTFTYVTQNGIWRRWGDRIYIEGHVAISAIGVAPTGTMRITGLPFTAAGTINGAVLFGYISNINYSAAALALTGSIFATVAYISLLEAFDNASTADVPAANFTNPNAQLRFVGFYDG